MAAPLPERAWAQDPGRASLIAWARPATSETVTVRAGCRTRPVGSIPATGSWNRMQRPRSGLLAKVSPRSASERWAGPTVFGHEYGPVSSVPATLARTVVTHHGP